LPEVLEMKDVGFGCMVDGKPAGIWPLGIVSASKVLERYRSRHPDKKCELVRVSISGPINPVSEVEEDKTEQVA
jgi:hypothetical protein